MKMHGICVYILCASLLIDAVYGSKGSVAGHSCSMKCDVVQELTLLRQLLNQESLMRINTNNEIMDLKKAMKDIVADFNQVKNQLNTSIGETATKIEETVVKIEETALKVGEAAMKIENLEKSTNVQHTEVSTAVQRTENTVQGLDSQLTKVKASVHRAKSSITALQNDNRAVKQDLTSLVNSVTIVKNDNRAARQDMTSLERTMTSMNLTLQARGSPVAFTAQRTSEFYSNIGKIIFDSVVTNVGGAYNGSTGTFTCPSPGVYVFTWTLTTYEGKYCRARLYINGSSRPLVAYAYLNGVSGTARSQSTMVETVRLSAGDTVVVRTDSCTYFWSSSYNAFSGWKL